MKKSANENVDSSSTSAREVLGKDVLKGFVLMILEAGKWPLTSKEIMAFAKSKYKLNDVGIVKNKPALSKVLVSLVKAENKLKTQKSKSDKRILYYGLSEWFEKSGELKEYYMKKIK